MKEVRKIEKAEDFVGWVSPDGKLTVVSIVKKSLEEKLETSMNKAYTYVVGSSMNCRIDNKY